MSNKISILHRILTDGRQSVYLYDTSNIIQVGEGYVARHNI